MKKQILITISLLMLSLSMLSGCSTTQVVTSNSTPAMQASEPIAFDEILDIGILPVDSNLPEDLAQIEKELIVPDVRRAESSYISYQLKDTLELTGNWGAVRVTPESSKSVDLELQGKILESDGERLKVLMRATDARGKVWFERTYEDMASKFSYEKPKEDPFQDLYNDIANDLLGERELLTREQVLEIKTVANLKFASDLAPDAFTGYLEESKRGQTKVVQLPAETDSMMQRVARIKEQEYLFVDTLDDYYSRFYRDMKPSYDEWRHATYDEAVRLREVQRQARNRLAIGALLIAGGIVAGSESDSWAGNAAAAGAVVGGIGAIKSGLERRKEAEIHEESLRELSQSLGTEITPYVLDIEGRTIELTGTAQEQYVQWRKLLREIYEQETTIPSQ
jgi:outer membrane lipoprotein SlyB